MYVFFTFLTLFSLSPLKNRYFEKKLLISTYFWSIFKFSRKIGPKFQNRPKISQNGQIFFSKYLFFDGDNKNDVKKVKNTHKFILLERTPVRGQVPTDKMRKFQKITKGPPYVEI